MEEFNPKKMLAALSPEQRASLMHELVACSSPKSPGLSPKSLLMAETWLWRQVAPAATPRHANARLRMWFIFMFLRHGGLRLKEIFQLSTEDPDFANAMINVPGAHARQTPMPPAAARRMLAAWQKWPLRLACPRPFLCDASQVRRALKQCADACALPAGRLNASALRRSRALELAADGLHPDLVEIFLGRGAASPLFAPQDATDIIFQYVQRGTRMKTSARNVFRGNIISLRDEGILVEVVLETREGLKITAVITSTSKKSLELAAGKPITAMVKAPWVTVWSESARAHSDGANCFQGKVESVHRDSLACEVLVTLPQGNQVCALYANGASPADDVKEGSTAFVSFGPFAVILLES